MQHVGLRTEVKLRFLLLHVDVNAMDAAPYSLGVEWGGGEGKERRLQRLARTDLISLHGKLTDLCVVCSSAFTANLNLISLRNVAGRDNLHSFFFFLEEMLAEAPRKLNLGDDVTVSANGCSSQSHLTSPISLLL